MDHYRQIAIFAKTADHGSFRAAANDLGLSPSVVSHHISQLENRLGTALIYRSTRKLSLTSDGRRLLAAAHDMVQAAEAGIQAVSDHSSTPSGELHITAPAVLAQSQLTDRIGAFVVKYPGVRLHIDFSDTRRELISGGFDIAIRMGWLEDSTLKAKKLYNAERRLVVSPNYLANRNVSASPADLEDWDWLSLTPVQSIRPTFEKAGESSVTLKPSIGTSVNDAHALCRLARAGAGLAIVPEFLAAPYIADETVKIMFPDWKIEPVGVYAVWPANVPKHGLSKLFINSLGNG